MMDNFSKWMYCNAGIHVCFYLNAALLNIIYTHIIYDNFENISTSVDKNIGMNATPIPIWFNGFPIYLPSLAFMSITNVILVWANLTTLTFNGHFPLLIS